MSKRKKRAITQDAGEARAEPDRAWAFPTRVRCPRCGSLHTLRVSSSCEGAVQHRRCQAPVCRYSFKIHGELV